MVMSRKISSVASTIKILFSKSFYINLFIKKSWNYILLLGLILYVIWPTFTFWTLPWWMEVWPKFVNFVSSLMLNDCRSSKFKESSDQKWLPIPFFNLIQLFVNIWGNYTIDQLWMLSLMWLTTMPTPWPNCSQVSLSIFFYYHGE